MSSTEGRELLRRRRRQNRGVPSGGLSRIRNRSGSSCDPRHLKSKSPSCGCGKIYEVLSPGTLTDSDGVTAALFRRHGIEIITEEDLENEA